MTHGREGVVEVAVWVDAMHARVVGDLLDIMGGAVRVLAVGGPREGEISALAQRFEHEPDDDLRHILVTHPAAFVVVGSLEELSLDDLRTATDQSAILLPLEPIIEDLSTLSHLDGKTRLASMLAPSPAMLQSPGFIRAAEPFEVLDEARTLSIETFGSAGEGSLFARLLDGWLTALAFAEMPEAIDAQFTAAADGQSQSLRRISGRVTAHGRLASGGSVCLLASDGAAGHRRRIVVLAGDVQLDIHDAGYRLAKTGGEVLDESAEQGAAIGYLDLVAAQWRRLIERVGTAGQASGPVPIARTQDALACCHASLLSARTGQPEDPRAVQRMAIP